MHIHKIKTYYNININKGNSERKLVMGNHNGNDILTLSYKCTIAHSDKQQASLYSLFMNVTILINSSE
jgi:hypothetical protein